MDKPYNQIQDFLNDDQFVEWVLSGRHERIWQQFLADHAHQRPLLEKARQLVLHIQEAESQDLPSLNQQRVWARIQHTVQEPVEDKSAATIPKRNWQPVRWAALIALLLGIGWAIQHNLPPNAMTYQELIVQAGGKNKLIEKINQGSRPLKLTLEDGSIITLEKNSKLSFPAHFERDKRNVILTGEAFFEIAKDPDRPFYICSNEVVTKVLGTSFRIRAFDDSKQVVVQVRTGRVSVYTQQKTSQADPETSGLVLRPNQQATYNRTEANLSRKLVDRPVLIAKKGEAGAFKHYDEVPATAVLKDIEKNYGISLLFNEELLSNCFITTALGNEPLYDQLDLVCKIIGATYKEVDAQLVIEAKGCK